MFDIKENLKKLPDLPGVYLHKDKLGRVIYVGKAVSLKNRVRQYFQSSKNQHPKVRAMVAQIEEFEYITCGSEMEALILECNLIKKYEPKYNILLRDDKTYPYIKVTAAEDFPRVIKTRRLEKDGSRYFGPYSDATAVNEVCELLNSMYRLKRCSSRRFPKGFRPCLNFHIGQCRGLCRLYPGVQGSLALSGEAEGRPGGVAEGGKPESVAGGEIGGVAAGEPNGDAEDRPESVADVRLGGGKPESVAAREPNGVAEDRPESVADVRLGGGKPDGVAGGEHDAGKPESAAENLRVEYAAAIDEILSFLSGHDKPLLSRLKDEMTKASEELRFEDAARARDNIRAIEALSQKQRVTILGAGDMDIVLPLKGGNYIVIFFVRGGKLTGRESYPMQLPRLSGEQEGGVRAEFAPGRSNASSAEPPDAEQPDAPNAEQPDAEPPNAPNAESPEAEQPGTPNAESPDTLNTVTPDSANADEATAEFIKQHYSEAPLIPQEILVSRELPEQELLQGYLSEIRGSAVKLYVPRRGDKKALLDLAKRDVTVMANTIDERAKAAEERREAFRAELDGVVRAWSEDHGLLPACLSDEGQGRACEGLAAREYRTETYDISHTNGVDTVAGMVVFEGGKPCKQDYRRFKVHIDHPDDYASLQEVLGRRLAHAFPQSEGDIRESEGLPRTAGLPENESKAARRFGRSYWPLPDIFLMDGGKGQVSAAEEVLEAWGIDDVPVIGMAKDDHHRTRALIWSVKRREPQPERATPECSAVSAAEMQPARSADSAMPERLAEGAEEMQPARSAESIMPESLEESTAEEMKTAAMTNGLADGENFREYPLREHPLLFKYAGTIQEEVHRFAIEYHRGLRGKRMAGSLLDNIKGVGPTKRNALLAHFGSIEKIKAASLEELMEVPGITADLAESVSQYLKR